MPLHGSFTAAISTALKEQRTASADHGLGDAGLGTVTGRAKHGTTRHRRPTVHNRRAGAARVDLGRPPCLYPQGTQTPRVIPVGFFSDRRPGRDLLGHLITEGHPNVGGGGVPRLAGFDLGEDSPGVSSNLGGPGLARGSRSRSTTKGLLICGFAAAALYVVGDIGIPTK
jgi:hypothetical protein